MLIRLYLGLNQKNGEPVPTHHQRECHNIVANAYESFTTFDATGCYRGETEPCRVYEVAVDDTEFEGPKAVAVAAAMAAAANQNCVGILLIRGAEFMLQEPA